MLVASVGKDPMASRTSAGVLTLRLSRARTSCCSSLHSKNSDHRPLFIADLMRSEKDCTTPRSCFGETAGTKRTRRWWHRRGLNRGMARRDEESQLGVRFIARKHASIAAKRVLIHVRNSAIYITKTCKYRSKKGVDAYKKHSGAEEAR